jgi:hypothetical protein
LDLLASLKLGTAKGAEQHGLIQPSRPSVSIKASYRDVQDAIVFNAKGRVLRSFEGLSKVVTAVAEM